MDGYWSPQEILSRLYSKSPEHIAWQQPLNALSSSIGHCADKETSTIHCIALHTGRFVAPETMNVALTAQRSIKCRHPCFQVCLVLQPMPANQERDSNELDLARGMARRRRTAIALTLLGTAAAITLYFVPPTASRMYPLCPLYAATGWHCPGCGATRCLHALMHGRVAEAASFNILFLLLLPVIVLLVGRALYASLAGVSLQSRPMPTWLLLVFTILLVAYGIARNVSYSPLDRLAPGRLFSVEPRE